MPEVTPDTGGYLILGLVASFGIMLALIGNMIVRYRSLQKDIEVMKRIEQDEH